MTTMHVQCLLDDGLGRCPFMTKDDPGDFPGEFTHEPGAVELTQPQ